MKYLIFILTMMFLFSCKKETMIKVHVENVATGEPYVDQLIYIRENPQNVNQENSTVYEGYTDSEGRLMIDFKYKRNAKYFIFISLPENYCYIHSLSYPINQEKTNDIHFRLAPCSQLKLKIENVNCDGSDDEIFYQRHWLSGSESSNGVTQTGCFSYDGSYFNVPMGSYKYTWDVTKNGNTDSFEEEFYISEGGQYDLEILY